MTKNLTCKTCGQPRDKGCLQCKLCQANQFCERQKAKAMIKKEKEQIRAEKKRIKRENHIPTLKKKADTAFSKFIRNRDDWTCKTCELLKKPNTQFFGANAHCSHFVGRMNMATRYEEKNCICQCAKENVFMEGNKPVFALYLTRKYGEGIIEELVKQGNTTIKADAQFFKDIIKKYDPQTKTRD